MTDPEKPQTPIENIPPVKSSAKLRNSEASTPSIRNALSSLGKKDQTENRSDIEIPDTEILAENELEPVVTEIILTEEDVLLQWKKFIDSLPPTETRMASALKNQDPLLDIQIPGIIISFRNKALVAEFKEKYKSSLISYFSQKLNREFDIHERVIETDEQPQTRYYTDTDKLRFMIEKNPAIAKLKQEFNLDFE